MSNIVQNILYITKDELYVHHELETVKVEHKKQTLLKIPIHHLRGIVIFSTSSISPSLLHKCLSLGISVTYLSINGRFMGRLEGYKSGNVLLRKEQFRKSENDNFKVKIAKSVVAGKLQNSRINLLRTARETKEGESENTIRLVVSQIESNLEKLRSCDSLNEIRGYEGSSAKLYFSVFNHCILHQKEDFSFDKRTKRPPRSRVNTLLSFLYSMFTNDCLSACQSVGLDPFVGFMHEERPGRPSLALDLVEEFRAMSDRLVLTMINRKQIKKEDITERPGAVYSLNDDGRQKVLKIYQERKKEELTHHYLNTKCMIGEIPLLQARLLARTIRGEEENYIPFIWK
ncbi:MAG: type I-C CRISPR-associated endonuclease Cas1 [Leptospiraceae bacterium]|nr:type I-C CRISPR-associated endonuclease Cas1 [Leptospiraceae bacterium]MCP5496105.1 type I-C CRISPR-associated endonuclease Cas1 [Leptospiraceae bacterium]